MIYTVNLISKDKEGLVTTTDLTNYVEQEFSLLEKLDETFDTGTITLVNTTREEPYKIWDTIQVLIDGTEFSSLRIAGDSVELSSKRPLRYNHTLSLVEHTKLLELFIISGKTFTQPTDGSTKYSIADVIETLFRVTPMSILGLVKRAISDDATISINETFVDFVFPNENIADTSTITVNEVFTDFLNKNVDITDTVSISVNELFTSFLNKNINITDNVTISLNEVFNNYLNKNINITANATISLTETFVNQVNKSLSINETGTISLNEVWYNNRPVEWVAGGTSTTPDQTCDSELDVGNVKKETTTNCECNVVDTYTSTLDLTTSPVPDCGDGVTYTLCLEDLENPGNYSCQDYACNQTTTTDYFTCELK